MSFSFLCMAYVLLAGPLVHTLNAEMNTESATNPKVTAVQNMRKEIQQERERLMQENREKRMEVIEENKMERQEFRNKTKETLKGLSPAQRKEAMPTIVQERKNMVQENIRERKEVRQGIVSSLQSFRASVQERWQNLFSSLFGKK